MKTKNRSGNGKLLHIESVTKRYGSLQVLEDIDLSITKGEFCSLVGPSGSGKSTLFRSILGEEKPTSGKVTINGNVVQRPDESKGIVYQGYALFEHLSVIDNVMKGPVMQIPNRKRLFKSKSTTRKIREIRERAMHYLESVRLADAAHKYPHQLSGGMRQRVAITQALMTKPQILLMDEPFGALDESTRRDAQLFLLELWEKYNMTIIFVTHDLDEALFLGSRFLAISQYHKDYKQRGVLQNIGARIGFDVDLDPVVNRRSQLSFEEYVEQHADIKEVVMRECFDPSYIQHVNEFQLTHKDSFVSP